MALGDVSEVQGCFSERSKPDRSLRRHSALQHYEELVQRGKWAQLAALFDGAATKRGLPQCSKTPNAIARRLEGMEEEAIIERMFATVSRARQPDTREIIQR
jgi:hypothetical protein